MFYGATFLSLTEERFWIRLLRRNAEGWAIDSRRIGMLDFSSRGQLTAYYPKTHLRMKPILGHTLCRNVPGNLIRVECHHAAWPPTLP